VSSLFVFVISLLFEFSCILFYHSICVQPIHYCAYELISICYLIAYNITFRVVFITMTLRLKMYLPSITTSCLESHLRVSFIRQSSHHYYNLQATKIIYVCLKDLCLLLFRGFPYLSPHNVKINHKKTNPASSI
jgi:hypothetical protein